MSEFVTKG